MTLVAIFYSLSIDFTSYFPHSYLNKIIKYPCFKNEQNGDEITSIHITIRL